MTNEEKAVDRINDTNSTTRGICDYFREKGMFYSEENGFPSYYKVRGGTYKEIPPNLPVTHKVWQIGNEDPKEIAKAMIACERMGGILIKHGRDKAVHAISREFMIEGSTLPIKVGLVVLPKRASAVNTGTMETYALYVKQMNLNRVFASVLHDLANGRRPSIVFSESSVVEKEVKGQSLFDAYNSAPCFLSDYSNRRELLKVLTLGNFLSLYDLDNGFNIIKRPDGTFEIIDFDKLFWEVIPNPLEELINPFVYKTKIKGKEECHVLPNEKLKKHFKREELERIVKEEQERIHQNIRSKEQMFFEVIRLMATIPSYNLSAKELYGEKDVEAFYLKKYSEFRPK